MGGYCSEISSLWCQIVSKLRKILNTSGDDYIGIGIKLGIKTTKQNKSHEALKSTFYEGQI